MQSAIGKERMEAIIKGAVFLVSCGTNDFVVNYFTLPIRRKNYTVSAYQQLVLQNLKQVLQDLWGEGARRIAVTGLPPMGCLPVVITLNSESAILERGCIEKFSRAGMEYNQMLQNELNSMQGRLAHLGAIITYIDIFTPLVDMIQGLGKHDFDEKSNKSLVGHNKEMKKFRGLVPGIEGVQANGIKWKWDGADLMRELIRQKQTKVPSHGTERLCSKAN
ncbi:hypothetical protein V6N13_076051 [Hibiscus sabdariffa]